MRAWMRSAAALVLMLLCACGAHAQPAQWTYGGRGEDRLLELTQVGGGFFAAGMTASDDGDLSMRTRTGDSGWAILIDENGERIWSYASAHNGLARMICPVSLADGRYALILTDEQAQRCEWLILDQRSRLISRTPVSPKALGLHEGSDVLAYSQSGGVPARLSLFIRQEEGGAICAASIDEEGTVQIGRPFIAPHDGIAASEPGGGLAWVCAEENRLRIVWIQDGDAERNCELALSGFAGLRLADALMQEDGSVLCCGAADDGGFAARISREGELLFARRLDCAQRFAAQTEMGYALYGAGETGTVVFMDEDGAVLDTAEHLPSDALDLCGAPDGAVLLSYQEGRRQKQAVISHVIQGETAQDSAADEALETQIGSCYEKLPLGEAYLLCAEEGYGVRIRCIDGHGQEVFSTRTPIHTAADRLEWLCAAQLHSGDILMGGRYIFEAEGRQAGVLVLLDENGVLRGMETMPDTGAICRITLSGQGHALLGAAAPELLSLTEAVQVTYMLPE